MQPDFLTTFALLVFLDLPYILLIGPHFFAYQGAATVIGGIIAYTLLALGLSRLCSRPMDAFILGLVVYGVYDMTNYATIPGWSLAFSALDTTWGAVLLSLVVWLQVT